MIRFERFINTNISGYSPVVYQNSIKIFPNPTNGIFNVFIKNENVNQLLISINDIQGREVFKIDEKNCTKNYEAQINLSDLAKGVYDIKLTTDTHVKTKKLVIE